MAQRLLSVVAAVTVACSRSPTELASSESGPLASIADAAEAPNVQPPPTILRAPDPSLESDEADGIEAWNPKQIDWKGFDEGLTVANKTNKPICLVIYATWCKHCRNYSKVFADPRLVLQARGFVMIRLDDDKDAAIAKRYEPDGQYVPRTIFLDSSGTINPRAHSDHPRYPHFFDELHADSLLEAMDLARPR